MKRLIGVLFLMFASLVVARADTIYAFSGSTTIDNYYEPGYGCSVTPCSLSGSFTMAEPLPVLADDFPISPISWDFNFPHRAGFDFTPNPGNNTFYIATDSQGNITQWDIHLDDQDWWDGPDTLHFYGTPEFSTVHVFDWADDICVGCDNFNLTGGWTDPVAVPEPGSIMLLATGLCGLLLKKH